MRIISHMEGTIVIRAMWEELRPVAGAAMPLVLSTLQSRYNFNNVGVSAIAQQAGMFTPNLQIGSMTEGDVSFPINSIEFQPHCLVVVCSTTDNANVFINDMFKFLAESFGFRSPETGRPKRYRSTIVFDPSGVDLDSTMGKWNKVLSFLNDKSAADISPHQTLGVRFASKDFGIIADGLPTSTPFIVERRVVSPPGENWWFSQAPVDTPTHLAILEKIEQTFR